MNWINNNISWMKDVFWIMFTLVATIVSIKTYMRAKSSILQPLRSEVIKRQTDLLVELLSFFMDKQNDFFIKVDYVNIVNVNVIISMKNYGFLLKNNEIYDKAEDNVVGFIILKKEGQLDNVKLPEIITNTIKTDNNSRNKEQEKGKEKLLLARAGKVDLEYLYLTDQYQETVEKIKQFQSNPFMPASIQVELSKLLREISHNLTVILTPEIKKFIIEITKTSSTPDNPTDVNPIAVYNNFQRKSNHHKDTIQRIIKLIREYLMVDKMWK